jgi:Lar family restriction alleviation protein
MTIEKLEPCPFCGGDAEVSMVQMTGVIRYYCYCQKCGTIGKMRRTAEDACLSWNLRRVEAST